MIKACAHSVFHVGEHLHSSSYPCFIATTPTVEKTVKIRGSSDLQSLITSSTSRIQEYEWRKLWSNIQVNNVNS